MKKVQRDTLSTRGSGNEAPTQRRTLTRPWGYDMHAADTRAHKPSQERLENKPITQIHSFEMVTKNPSQRKWRIPKPDRVWHKHWTPFTPKRWMLKARRQTRLRPPLPCHQLLHSANSGHVLVLGSLRPSLATVSKIKIITTLYEAVKFNRLFLKNLIYFQQIFVNES